MGHSEAPAPHGTSREQALPGATARSAPAAPRVVRVIRGSKAPDYYLPLRWELCKHPDSSGPGKIVFLFNFLRCVVLSRAN